MTPEPERDEGDGGHAPATLPTAAELDAPSRAILEAAWRADGDGGFCVPNATTYPWQWLWDSCFHAVVWAHLGDERAGLELRGRAGRPGRRRLRPPHPLRRRARPRTPTFWGRAAHVVDHPAADVRPRGRRGRAAPACPWPTRWSSGPAAGCAFLLRAAPSLAGRAGGAVPPVGVGLRRQPAVGRRCSTGRGRRDGVVRGQGRAARRRSSAAPAARRWPTPRSRSVRSGSPRWWRGTRSSWPRVTGDDDARAATPASSPRRSTPAGTPTCCTWVDDGPTAARLGPRPHARRAPARCSSSTDPRRGRQLTDPAAFGAPFGPTRRAPRRADVRPHRLLAGLGRGPSSPTCRGGRRGGPATARPRRPSRTRWPRPPCASGFAEHWEPDSGGAARRGRPSPGRRLACVVGVRPGPSGPASSSSTSGSRARRRPSRAARRPCPTSTSRSPKDSTWPATRHRARSRRATPNASASVSRWRGSSSSWSASSSASTDAGRDQRLRAHGHAVVEHHRSEVQQRGRGRPPPRR